MSMRLANYAVSPEGQGGKEEVDYSVLNHPAKRFDARQNLIDVVHAAVSGSIRNESLLYAAAAALQRQERSTETASQWAERLSHSFFDDLDDKA